MAIDNWKQVSLGEQVDLLTGFPFKSAEYTEDISGIPLVRGDNVVQGMFRWDDVKRWSKGKVEKLSDYFLREDDVVLAMDRPWIEAGLKYACVSKHDIPCLLVQRVSRLRANATLDQKFLRYVIGSSEFTNYILGTQTGTAVPHISGGQIKNYKFLLPSLSEQRAIAGILSALDDKIEVNRRMNVTLEAMARAVFLEMIKDVEEQGSILKFADLLGGGTPKTSEPSYWDGSIEWVSAKDVGNVEGIFLLDTEKKITQDGVNNSSTKLLLEKTTIVTARGTVGAHCILGKPMTMNQSNYGLKAKKGVGDYFVYFTLSEMIDQLKQQSYGTIFDTITTKIFQNVQCAQPSHDIIKKIEDQITPMMEAILNNQKESRTLGSLRDSLLPRLMRGEVRVKDVEESL